MWVVGQCLATVALPPGKRLSAHCTVQEAGWARGPVWTDADTSSPAGLRLPDRPARNKSLYQLGYPGLPPGLGPQPVP